MSEFYENDGTFAGRNYTLYAYCLMSNHFHLLIREREESLAMAVKRIASSYVHYFNSKYQRDGHLFRERYRSEPVNDMEYFTTLLRYIHQNPVKAGIVENVKDYPYSSWGEYAETVEPSACLCNTRVVLNRIPFEDLEILVNEALPDDVICIDIEEPSHRRPSDDQVWQIIREMTGTTNSSAFQLLSEDIKRKTLKDLKDRRASLRQLARLTGIGKGVIHRIWNSQT